MEKGAIPAEMIVAESSRVLPLMEKKAKGSWEGERRESLRSWKVRFASSRVRVSARFRDLTSGDRINN